MKIAYYENEANDMTAYVDDSPWGSQVRIIESSIWLGGNGLEERKSFTSDFESADEVLRNRGYVMVKEIEF